LATHETFDKGDRKVQFASGVEAFLAKVYGPELLSNQGRAAILSIWTVLALVSAYAAMNVKIHF
jgi:hypothetical protein